MQGYRKQKSRKNRKAGRTEKLRKKQERKGVSGNWKIRKSAKKKIKESKEKNYEKNKDCMYDRTGK